MKNGLLFEMEDANLVKWKVRSLILGDLELTVKAVSHLFLNIQCVQRVKLTRSTGTVHTSAKARLTSVTIQIRVLIRIPDPDCHQYLIICSLAHCQSSWKFHGNPFGSFCAKLLTNRQTTTKT